MRYKLGMTEAQRLQAAWARRAPLHADKDTTAYRLLNGAADGFPDLTVDRYGSVLVANLYSAGEQVPPPTRLLETLADWAGSEAVYVKYRPLQASALDEAERQALAPAEALLGRAVDEVEALENGLRFLVRPAEGLSTGLFLDMRTVRAWLREQAKGRTILNCFAYTCGFGLAGLTGGAARVANLDVSKRYLEWGQRNYALNGLSAPTTDFIFGDVFDWLKRFARSGTRFDLVVLDPPSYATTRQTRFSLAKDYASLVALAAPVVKAGGRLLACANTVTLSRKNFLAQIRRGVPEFGATVLKVEHEPDLDFPVAPGSEPYLKAAWVNVGN
jgi:23S rRNA (cytosine1962-C5)-methyltransferase